MDMNTLLDIKYQRITCNLTVNQQLDLELEYWHWRLSNEYQAILMHTNQQEIHIYYWFMAFKTLELITLEIHPRSRFLYK